MPSHKPAKNMAAAASPAEKLFPIKKKVLRPKSPSPAADSNVAWSGTDDDGELVAGDSEGSEPANDSDIEFIDDRGLFETDGDEDPLLGIIPSKKGSSGVKHSLTAAKPAPSTAGKKTAAKGASAKSKSAKNNSRGKRDASSDDDVKSTSLAKEKPVSKVVKTSPAKKAVMKKKSVRELADSDDGDGVEDAPLDPDDSMYSELPPSQKIFSKKRGLVTTPPLRTRSAANRTESPMESPTKKARFAGVSPQTPKRNVSKSPSKLFAKLSTEDGDSDASNPFEEETTLAEVPQVYLADLTTLTVKSLPEICEVDDENLHDPLLAERNLYNDLPNLAQCELKTAGAKVYSGRGQGRFMFSAWPNVCPSIKMKTAMNVIAFKNDEHYINPSRVSPLLLEARLLSGNSRYELSMLGQTAVCVSLICVMESFIHETPSYLKLAFHAIKGCYHSQEHERFAASMGMVTGQQVLGMQIWNDIVTFQTKLNDVSSTVTPSNYNRVADKLPAACFNTYNSPIKGKQAAPDVIPATVLSALEFNHPIPVYDARKLKDNFKWSADIFNHLGAHFPQWDKEIPKYSCVIVGYIVNFMAGSGNAEWKLYNNIQWAVILAIPPA